MAFDKRYTNRGTVGSRGQEHAGPGILTELGRSERLKRFKDPPFESLGVRPAVCSSRIMDDWAFESRFSEESHSYRGDCLGWGEGIKAASSLHLNRKRLPQAQKIKGSPADPAGEERARHDHP